MAKRKENTVRRQAGVPTPRSVSRLLLGQLPNVHGPRRDGTRDLRLGRALVRSFSNSAEALNEK